MNSRVIGVCVLALLAVVAVSADAEVSVAAGATEAAAVAETQTAAAAVTETAAAAVTETAAKTETAAAATATTAAATDATAAAATAATATAAATATTQAAAEKPKGKGKKADAKAKTTFKPVMINRHSRRAMRSQRHDIRYTDGGLAPVLTFGPGPLQRLNRNAVEADVASPLARRFARWANSIEGDKRKYFTPRYSDERERQRYESVVPAGAFFAPRLPTHFEPEYHDEHAVLSVLDNIADAALPPAGAPVFGAVAGDVGGLVFDGEGAFGPYVTVIRAEPRRPRTFEPEYEDEHRLLSGGDVYDNSEVEYLPSGLPVLPNVPFEDLLTYERAIFPDAKPRRQSSWSLYGLPQFPEMPLSAQRHIERTGGVAAAAADAPFSGLDDPFGTGFGLGVGGRRAAVEYPRGAGPEASLRKLDFALERLQTLNAQLQDAERKIAASRVRQAEAEKTLARLNRIRSNLSKMATQIAALERKMGQDGAVQAEVAQVVAAKDFDGMPVLGGWLGGEWVGQA